MYQKKIDIPSDWSEKSVMLTLERTKNTRVWINGEEQTNYDELVGTGMILKISKDNQTIELIISVLGDINENGKVGGDTLTELRGILYENMEVDELFIKSLDINGNKTIEAEDLTLIRGVLYEEQII